MYLVKVHEFEWACGSRTSAAPLSSIGPQHWAVKTDKLWEVDDDECLIHRGVGERLPEMGLL